MARPRSRSDDAPALFDAPTSSRGRARRGRHERAVDRAVGAGRRDRILTDRDAALVSMLRALGRALDHAEQTDQPYAVAQVARELRAGLIDARLTPGPVAQLDPFAALLEDLGTDDAPAPA